MREKPQWTSVHLFVAEQRDIDVLALHAAAVIDRVAPQADWFFIRYNEGGVHLRLRFEGVKPSGQRAIRREMADACEALANGRERSSWARAASIPGRDGFFANPGEAIDVEYKPEVDRYGGPCAISASERLFCRSTAVAIGLIRTTGDDLGRRSAAASDLMLMAVAAMLGVGTRPRRFFEAYADSWRFGSDGGDRSGRVRGCEHDLTPRFSQHAVIACEPSGSSSPVNAWGKALYSARMELDALREKGTLLSPDARLPPQDEEAFDRILNSLVHSHIHMMNNRLGFWPGTEILLADNLARRLYH